MSKAPAKVTAQAHKDIAVKDIALKHSTKGDHVTIDKGEEGSQLM